MGGYEGSLPGGSEPSLRDHSGKARILMMIPESGHLTVSGGQFIWGGCLDFLGRLSSNAFAKLLSYMREQPVSTYLR